jgi:hypothetical protein
VMIAAGSRFTGCAIVKRMDRQGDPGEIAIRDLLVSPIRGLRTEAVQES